MIREKIDLYKLIQGSLESYFRLAQAKKVALTRRLDPQLPLIYADGRRIEQILANFIAHASNFTSSGGVIEVGAVRTNVDLQMWVKDSGVRIPPDEIGQLFEKYRQTTSGKTSDRKGTGFGLVICKMIAEAHGVKISLQSDFGRGSTFAVQLPVQ